MPHTFNCKDEKNQKNDQSLLHMMKILWYKKSNFQCFERKSPKITKICRKSNPENTVAYFQLLKGTLQQKVCVYKGLWSIIVEQVNKF